MQWECSQLWKCFLSQTMMERTDTISSHLCNESHRFNLQALSFRSIMGNKGCREMFVHNMYKWVNIMNAIYIYKWSMLVIRPERLSVSSPVTLTWQSLVIYEEFLRCFKTHYHLCHSWCFVSVLQLMFLAYLFFLVWLGVTAFTSLPVFMYFNVWSMCQNTSVVEGANLCLDLRQFGVYNDNVTYLWNGWMEVSNLPFFNSLFYHVSGLQ